MKNEETKDIDLNNEEVELEDDSELMEDSDELAKIKAEKERLERELGSLKRDFKKLTKAPLQTNDGVEGLKKTVSELKNAELKRQFGYENGLAPDEVDYIFKVNNKPTKDLLEDPFIKGGLDAIRTQKKIANNTPTASSRSPRFEIPKKDDLTSDDKQKAFEEYLRAKKGL